MQAAQQQGQQQMQQQMQQMQQQIQQQMKQSKYFYLDLQNDVQGPFEPDDMQKWFGEGYFQPTLPIRFGESGVFVPLQQIFKDQKDAFAQPPLSWQLAQQQRMQQAQQQMAQQQAQQQQQLMQQQQQQRRQQPQQHLQH